jgi:glyoxylase-like metal-dependent hydrolase (beta-lactamase superfamily II)
VNTNFDSLSADFQKLELDDGLFALRFSASNWSYLLVSSQGTCLIDAGVPAQKLRAALAAQPELTDVLALDWRAEAELRAAFPSARCHAWPAPEAEKSAVRGAVQGLQAVYRRAQRADAGLSLEHDAVSGEEGSALSLEGEGSLPRLLSLCQDWRQSAPLPQGMTLLGQRVQLIPCLGMLPGSCLLWCSERGALFCGEMLSEANALAWVADFEAQLALFERCRQLPLQHLLGRSGASQGQRRLGLAQRLLSGLLPHLLSALGEAKTALQLAQPDFAALSPEHELSEHAIAYQLLLEQLVVHGELSREGEAAAARFQRALAG